MQRLTLFVSILTISLFSQMGCGAPQTPEPEPSKVITPAPEPPPECLPGCMFNDDNICQLEGTVVDGSSVDIEVIPCDPRCCEEAVKSVVDADSDGVANDRDQCPEKAEDFDGFQDEDGCPDEDNDGDKIPDDDDVCPLDAEDIDGFQDADGCPD